MAALFWFALGETVGFVGARAAAHLARKRWPRLLHVEHFPGIHVNHFFWGLILAAIGSFVAIVMDGAPLRALAALLTGVGFGMVLDETAMLLYLADVYFEPRGRLSVWVGVPTTLTLWLMVALVWAARTGTAALTLAVIVGAGGVAAAMTTWVLRIRCRRDR